MYQHRLLVTFVIAVALGGCASSNNPWSGSPHDSPCSLSARQLERRRSTLSKQLKPGIQEVIELPDGYALRFQGDGQWDRKLMDFVLFERSCCGSMTFELAFSSDGGPIWLSLRGDDAVKPLLKESFEDIGILPTETSGTGVPHSWQPPETFPIRF